MEAKEDLDGMGMVEIQADERAEREAVAVVAEVATVETVAVPAAAGAAPKTVRETRMPKMSTTTKPRNVIRKRRQIPFCVCRTWSSAKGSALLKAEEQVPSCR